MIAIDSVSFTGELVVSFSKEVLIPLWVEILPGMFSSLEERLASLDMTKFLTLQVESDQFSASDSEIAIADYFLVEFTAYHMTLQVEFENPNMITTNAASPDTMFATVVNN